MNRYVLVNPNTSAAATALMVSIAEMVAGPGRLIGLTAPAGTALIADEAALAAAASEVAGMAAGLDLRGVAGVAIAAFGDPGLAAARAAISVPVVGIAEAAIAEAQGRRFAIVTSTPGLDASIRRMVASYGAADALTGIHYTLTPVQTLIRDPDQLRDELRAACKLAVGADAIIIGGGPLAAAARALRDEIGVPLIEPVPAAIRALMRRAGEISPPASPP